MVYGTMGGDGQPQTQATVFNRIQRFGLEPQAAIELPRWLLGRTWGSAATASSSKRASRIRPSRRCAPWATRSNC